MAIFWIRGGYSGGGYSGGTGGAAGAGMGIGMAASNYFLKKYMLKFHYLKSSNTNRRNRK
jgi:hypothetical protein